MMDAHPAQPTSFESAADVDRVVGWQSYDARQLGAVLLTCRSCMVRGYFTHPERQCPKCRKAVL